MHLPYDPREPVAGGQPTPPESQETASGAALDVAKDILCLPMGMHKFNAVASSASKLILAFAERHAERKNEQLVIDLQDARIDAAAKACDINHLRQQLDAARAELERLKIPPSAIRDCTLDELIQQLEPDHLAAKQIAGLRSMAAKNAKVCEHDLRLLGSVALMRENDKLAARIAELERENGVERMRVNDFSQLVAALQRENAELRKQLTGHAKIFT